MTFDEALILLIFANSLDARVNCSDEAASAWTNVLGPAIALEDAMRYVREHYLESDRTVMPAHIVGRHRIARRAEIESAPKPEPTHDCMDGYILIEQQTSTGQTYTAAAPCPQCTTVRHQSAKV